MKKEILNEKGNTKVLNPLPVKELQTLICKEIITPKTPIILNISFKGILSLLKNILIIDKTMNVGIENSRLIIIKIM